MEPVETVEAVATGSSPFRFLLTLIERRPARAPVELLLMIITPEPAILPVRANGLGFSCLSWDPPTGRTRSRGLVLALHGFPDHARTFRRLGPTLAAQGYRVVAPYLRGYAPTEITLGPFHPMVIARDVVELAASLRQEDEELFLIGHDWGAAATYLAASAMGREVAAIAALAVPPGGGFLQSLVTDPEQQRRSWYMFFFQLPVAEQAVAYQDFALIERLWRDWSPSYVLPEDEMEELKQTFRKSGVLTAALGYYRHAFQPPVLDDATQAFAARAARKIAAPCLYLHGSQDGCIGFETSAGMEEEFAGELRREKLDGLGHFLHLENPELVHSMILEFFESASSRNRGEYGGDGR